MAGKKDRAVVAVISELTQNQAVQISKDIYEGKSKICSSWQRYYRFRSKEQCRVADSGRY